MKDRLAEFVSELFKDAPKTRQARDLREELLISLHDKYDDLVKEGHQPDDAYKNVISNVGDVGELIRALEDPVQISPSEEREQRKKSALLTAIGIMLLILSPMMYMIFDGYEGAASVGFFLFVAAGVGLLVFNSIMNPAPHKRSRSDNLVDEFKQFSATKDRDRRLKNAIITCMWALSVPIYLVVSFASRAWAYTWMIFPIIAAITAIIISIFAFKE